MKPDADTITPSGIRSIYDANGGVWPNMKTIFLACNFFYDEHCFFYLRRLPQHHHRLPWPFDPPAPGKHAIRGELQRHCLWRGVQNVSSRLRVYSLKGWTDFCSRMQNTLEPEDLAPSEFIQATTLMTTKEEDRAHKVRPGSNESIPCINVPLGRNPHFHVLRSASTQCRCCKQRNHVGFPHVHIWDKLLDTKKTLTS